MSRYVEKPVIETHKGAEDYILQFKAKNDSGENFSLAGYDTVRLYARYQGTDTTEAVMIDGAECTVTDAVAGEFEYKPKTDELSKVGDYKAQVELIDGTDLDYLEEFIIRVYPVVEGSS